MPRPFLLRLRKQQTAGESWICCAGPLCCIPGPSGEQLEYIRTSWGRLLGSGEESDALLATLGFLEEEERPFFGGGPGEQNPYVYSPNDREGFSEDQSWMPTVVMMAKNVLVWLHQISLKKGKVPYPAGPDS